jgi:hypothetical protein
MTQALSDPFMFDAGRHEYRLGDRIIPSVTGILKDEGFIETHWFKDEARDRGIAVHEAVLLFFKDRLSWETVDPRISGCVVSAIHWMAKRKVRPVLVELPLVSRAFGYGGTPDLLGIVPEGRHNTPWLFDFKTGPPAPWHTLQLAAYHHLLLSNRGELDLGVAEMPMRHAAVHLFSDGECGREKPIVEPIQQAVEDWLCIAKCHHIKRKRRANHANGNGANHGPGFEREHPDAGAAGQDYDGEYPDAD